MSFVKAVPEGLKWMECKCGIRRKNAPVCYVPQQDPVQDVLEKSKKTTYFKQTLPNTGNKLKVSIWVSRTPEQFLMHVHTGIHMCKQVGLEANFSHAKKAVTTA